MVFDLSAATGGGKKGQVVDSVDGSCEGQLVVQETTLSRLIQRSLEKDTLTTAEVMEWINNPNPKPLQYKQTAESANLSLRKAIQRTIQKSTLEEWKQTQQALKLWITQREGQQVRQEEVREETSGLLFPQEIPTPDLPSDMPGLIRPVIGKDQQGRLNLVYVAYKKQSDGTRTAFLRSFILNKSKMWDEQPEKLLGENEYQIRFRDGNLEILEVAKSWVGLLNGKKISFPTGPAISPGYVNTSWIGDYALHAEDHFRSTIHLNTGKILSDRLILNSNTIVEGSDGRAYAFRARNGMGPWEIYDFETEELIATFPDAKEYSDIYPIGLFKQQGEINWLVLSKRTPFGFILNLNSQEIRKIEGQNITLSPKIQGQRLIAALNKITDEMTVSNAEGQVIWSTKAFLPPRHEHHTIDFLEGPSGRIILKHKFHDFISSSKKLVFYEVGTDARITAKPFAGILRGAVQAGDQTYLLFEDGLKWRVHQLFKKVE